LARQIVDQISNDEFHPEQYCDTAIERLEKIIAEKVEGKEITAAPQEEPEGQIIDLMEALKSSLAGYSSEQSSAATGRKDAKRKTSARRKATRAKAATKRAEKK